MHYSDLDLGTQTRPRYGSDLLACYKLGQYVKPFKSYHPDTHTHTQTERQTFNFDGGVGLVFPGSAVQIPEGEVNFFIITTGVIACL